MYVCIYVREYACSHGNLKSSLLQFTFVAKIIQIGFDAHSSFEELFAEREMHLYNVNTTLSELESSSTEATLFYS